MFGIFSDFKLVAGVLLAFIAGAGAGHWQGERTGKKNGELICQAKNKKVTEAKNEEIARDSEAGAIADDKHGSRVREAIRKFSEGTDRSQQCAVLTDKERGELDAIQN